MTAAKKNKNLPYTKKTTSWTRKTSEINAAKPKQTMSNSAFMWVLHLVGGILGSRWWLAVLIYYIIKKDTFSSQDMEVFYNIINFNISFLLYAVISGLLVVILIGLPMLAIVSVTYIILLVVSSLYYISDKPYSIPFSIQILK